MCHVINEISFSQINCDFPIWWTLFEHSITHKNAIINQFEKNAMQWNFYRVACRLELPSSNSASGDGASDLVSFVVKLAIKFDDVILSIIHRENPLNRESALN